MRILVLTIAFMALAMPAFANCGATHEASNPNTVATTSTGSTQAPATDSSGG